MVKNKEIKNLVGASMSGISKKTTHKIIKAWQESGYAPSSVTADISERDAAVLVGHIRACIKNEGGDISRKARVVHLAMIYLQASPKGKKRFLRILATQFDVDTQKLQEKIDALNNLQPDAPERVNAEIELTKALIPPRVEFLRQLSSLPNGFIFLMNMRQELLKLTKEVPRLKKLDHDLKNLLVNYFNLNLLKLKEITWDSPASMLESITNYEAVHPIKSWRHLKHRLQTDHRMFGFFHPVMPNEPIIFVEVALVKGLADNIQKVIELDTGEQAVEDADTAIFYSISSTQKGLRGISFGNFLIKQVVKLIRKEYSGIKNFSSLSPIPLFASWLTKYLTKGGNSFCTPSEKQNILKISKQKNINKAVLELLDTKKWFLNKQITTVLQKPLYRLCVHYLSKEKRQGRTNAYDPVANFHLSNGALIRQVNWLGDTSEKGMKQSFGFMVNYKYKLAKIAEYHEAYLTSGTIHIAEQVLKKAK